MSSQSRYSQFERKADIDESQRLPDQRIGVAGVLCRCKGHGLNRSVDHVKERLKKLALVVPIRDFIDKLVQLRISGLHARGGVEGQPLGAKDGVIGSSHSDFAVESAIWTEELKSSILIVDNDPTKNG